MTLSQLFEVRQFRFKTLKRKGEHLLPTGASSAMRNESLQSKQTENVIKCDWESYSTEISENKERYS
jgi:hypothetical protein